MFLPSWKCPLGGRRVVVVEKIDAAVCVPVSSLFAMTESLIGRCQNKTEFAMLDCRCLCANRAHNLSGDAPEDTSAMRQQQLTRSRMLRYRAELRTNLEDARAVPKQPASEEQSVEISR